MTGGCFLQLLSRRRFKREIFSNTLFCGVSMFGVAMTTDESVRALSVEWLQRCMCVCRKVKNIGLDTNAVWVDARQTASESRVFLQSTCCSLEATPARPSGTRYGQIPIPRPLGLRR